MKSNSRIGLKFQLLALVASAVLTSQSFAFDIKGAAKSVGTTAGNAATQAGGAAAKDATKDAAVQAAAQAGTSAAKDAAAQAGGAVAKDAAKDAAKSAVRGTVVETAIDAEKKVEAKAVEKNVDVEGGKAKVKAKVTEKMKAVKEAKASKGSTAIIKTTAGDITVKLFADKAPLTIANFVGLATGKKEWTDPTTGKKSKAPLYNGTLFHRIIPNFMVQGGDPLGTGTGGPGYQFADETSPSDNFDKPGILAMANAGPNTNGSQFFITVAPTPWLNGRHTIFGEVTKGMDVVNKIVGAPKGAQDRPENPEKIKSIVIK